MDVLSDVIAVMRTGQPRSAHVRWHAPWGQEFASVPGSAAFQVILQGSCWLHPPDAEPVQLAAGDVLFLPRGSGHTLADSSRVPAVTPACEPDDPRSEPYALDRVDRTGDGGPVTVVLCGTYQLDPARSHPLMRDLPDRVHLPAQPDRHSELRSAVELLAAELEHPDRLGRSTAVPALLDTLLLYILRIWFDERSMLAGNSGWAAALNDPPVTAALQAIHRAPEAQWTVAKLAAEAGLSRAPFARRFATLVGQPPLSYLTWWRMTVAERLLLKSDAPLRSIAAHVGYASEFAFSTAFKRAHGTAPGAFRRRS